MSGAVHSHGYGGYTRGCRCQVCRDAKATYMRDKRKAARDAATAASVAGTAVRYVVQGITHGIAGYKDHACRCLICTRAKTAEDDARRGPVQLVTRKAS